MAKYVGKFYKFKCPDCDSRFEKFMWVENGVQEGVTCPGCAIHLKHNITTADVNQPNEAPMINVRENWKKKIPQEFKEFLDGPFRERHGDAAKIDIHGD